MDLFLDSHFYSIDLCFARSNHWGNWAKGMKDLSVLFLTTARNHTIMLTKIYFKKANIILIIPSHKHHHPDTTPHPK